ncbi:ubiquitin carboxyl-terminal hydrolase 2-like [Zootermopsis nevadensis]|nr:ubiquitin carboxyl-terminal hydrolase 2-like [Zootermopsis nevadensis]XP_021918595.1 ubiquitin carboxyl-terminal hydrolase 2-like [Zootermopsis nevadensis]XP_021918596.1 ubiquitin carboxyl-terminal hydrolase 2-like [Zootermopsis nevadensis]
MPYRSGAVATVSPASVSYKMPVPASHSRFTSLVSGSSHRTSSSLNSSLDRSYYTSLTRTIPRSYTLDYKSKYTSPSRSTLSSSSYSRQGSLSDDSGISLSSGRNAGGRERSESRESSIGGYSRVRDSGRTTSTTTTTLGRRFGTSTCTLSGISVTEMFNKYSPSNYTRCSTDSTADSVCSRSHSATTTSSRRSVGVGGAVGGCSTSSIEQRRSRLSSTEDDNTACLSASPRFSRLRGSSGSSADRGGLAGLRNIGNTCFMNSVIQCLSNTKPLLEYLLGDCHLSDINTSISSMKGALIKAFSTVIQELWRAESEDRVVNTTALKSQIQRFAPRFMGYCQQDAQEFLRYLLEGLHEDVNRVTTKPKPILTDVDEQLSDQQKAVESWKRYLRMDNSKVVDIFVGQLKSTLRCTSCGHCSVTFDPFWDLSLPIPVRTGQVRLQQCFDHFTREEVLDGDEKPTCSKCQMRRKCTKSFTIQKFPKILVLHLKRFSPTERFRGKLNVTVDFPLNGLDLSTYAANRGQGCMYNLYGVANHSGTTYSGHYTAYCKHPYTAEWHEYNDSRVTSISSRSVVSSEAYVLFFELSGHSSHL